MSPQIPSGSLSLNCPKAPFFKLCACMFFFFFFFLKKKKKKKICRTEYTHIFCKNENRKNVKNNIGLEF
jgi:hypothetical protein